MPPTAQLITEIIDGRDFRPRLVIDERGQEGVRHFRVNAVDPEEILLDSAGLPGFADRWSDRLPDLIVRRIDNPVVLGGTSAGASGVDWAGWSVVPVLYRSQGFGGSLPIPKTPDDKWTLVRGGSRSQNILYGVRGTPNWDIPINNGSGASIETGEAEYTVYTHRLASLPVPVATLYQLATPNKVNSGPVTTPPLFGSGTLLTFPKGTLRYKSYEINYVNGFIQIAHTLVASSPDHHLYWQRTNDKGEALDEPPIVSTLYEERSFGGLW